MVRRVSGRRERWERRGAGHGPVAEWAADGGEWAGGGGRRSGRATWTAGRWRHLEAGDGAVVVREGETYVLVGVLAGGAEDEHIVVADADGDEGRVLEREGQQLGRACVLELTWHSGKHAREFKLGIRLPLRARLGHWLGDLNTGARCQAEPVVEEPIA